MGETQQLINSISAEFQDLMHRIVAIDNEDRFLAELVVMPQAEIQQKLRAVQNYALRLGFEEVKEMQRGRSLNILGPVSDLAHSNIPPLSPPMNAPVSNNPSSTVSQNVSSKT